MAFLGHYPLQKAIYQTLTGDSSLMAMVNGVFDRVPQGQAYPYISVGSVASEDASTKTSNATEIKITLNVWGREGGKKQIELIINTIYGLLHLNKLTLSGQTLVSIRYQASNIALQNDGFTYLGTISFRAMVEAN